MTMTIPQPATERFRVRDQFQVIEFDGALIGEATTEVSSSPRWTEIEIYKTVAGNYVVHRVGASLVYHRLDTPCASGVSQTVGHVLDHDDRQLEPCERCQPCDIYGDDVDHDVKVRVETDRHSATAVTVDGVVEALTLSRPNRSQYVSNVAQQALNQALHNDPKLADTLAARTYVP